VLFIAVSTSAEETYVMGTEEAGGARTLSTIFDVSESAVMQAEAAGIDSGRAEVVEQSSFTGEKGVSLKAGLAANVESSDTEPDLVFKVRASLPGRYVIRTHAATDAEGREVMRQAGSKHESLRLMIAIDDGRPTKRVIFVPWSSSESCKQTTGKFSLNGEEQEIRVWLPQGVRLDYLEVSQYILPEVPTAAIAYRPTVVPPVSRPRIWVNEESLPKVRANLTQGENAPLWAQVREAAAVAFELEVEPGTEISYDSKLEEAAVAKAFVYLMSGEKERGQEAVALIRTYLSAVEFGNLLDITREIGRAIYSAALVYDWCYDLMSPDDRESVQHHLMRLADDMEIGWPPFKQTLINGHGNEAQVNRDLLCMAIALYDEDSVPYRYCSYRVLEELVPMRRFEYQSPRHNQGVSYGPYRFGWDMHAAWLFYRMTGKRVFDDNIADVCKFWLYMRLPNEETFRDGDGFADGRRANLGITSLLSYAYGNDPVIKRDFERQGGLPHDPILVLLLNDPNLATAEDFGSLPLSLDFGPILGSMIARTGWNMGQNASDVVVEMKGGGYHFGNHQHSDAGSFQIYYRGLQAVDLGQYHFYGTPYDYNFCKRSVSHSMMLAVDPDEKFLRTPANDGGTRFIQSSPITPEQARTDPTFANGTVVSADFGPSRQRPFYSYFSVDLTSAYSEKVEAYVRTFCFLNLDDEKIPAVLVVLDNMTTARPEFRKYWQVNSLNLPETTVDGVILRNSDLGLAGKVDLRMLRPKADERDLQILSGEDANSVFGQFFTPPKPDRPEANGHRVMFSPTKEQVNDVFLTVMSMSDEKAQELPIDLAELPDAFVLTLADRVVVLSRTGELLERALQVEVRGDESCQLLLGGLAPGAWSIRDEEGKVQFNTRVEANRNSAFFVVPGGKYTVQPEVIPGATEFRVAPDFMPAGKVRDGGEG
jgi:heparin/heparan-sulfate lyase